MKKTLKYALIGFLLSTQSFAGLPPTSVRGQSDSSDKVKFNLQAPNNQMTDLGGIKALVETGNDNLLKNPGFEASTVDTGWTCTSMNQESTTTAEDTPIKGKQSIEFKPVDATSRCYQQVTAQAADIGKLGEFSLTTKVLNVGTAHDWWLQILNGDGTVVEAESQILFDSTNSVTTKVEFQIESSQRVQIITKSDSPDQIIADDASFKPATNIGTVAQAKMVLSVVGLSSAQSIPASTITKVTNWNTPSVLTSGSFSSGTFTLTESGVCDINGAGTFSGTTSASAATHAHIYHNGSEIVGGYVNASSGGTAVPQAHASFECSAGDTIDFRIDQYGSGSANISIGEFTVKLFPSKAQQTITPSDQVDVTSGGLWFPDACPSGMVDAENKVVGKSSGDYQGARYLNLYRHLWTNAATSGSAYVLSATKGASADADWAAGTTITINMGGIFPRVHGGTSPNVSGDLGMLQLDAMQGHRHSILAAFGSTTTSQNVVSIASPATNANFSSGNGTNAYVGDPVTDGTHGTPRVASETRPYNTAMKFCMFANPTVPQPVVLPKLVTATYRNSSGQSIPNAVDTTVTNWTKVKDDAGLVNPTTGVITLPPNGTYRVSFGVEFNPNTTGLRVAGLTCSDTSQNTNSVATSGAVHGSASISSVLFYSGASAITVTPFAFQTSGGSLSLVTGTARSYLFVEKLGGYE